MKINSRDLKRFLEQDFKKFTAALLVGNNERLMSDAISNISARVIGEQESCNKVRISASHLAINFHLLLNEVRTAPLFGGKKVIIVSDITQPSLFVCLQDFLQNEPTSGGVYLIMSCSRILGDSVKASFETSSRIAVLPCYLEDLADQGSIELDGDVYVTLMFEKKILQAELVLEKLISAGMKSSQVIRCALRYYTQLYAAHGLLRKGIPFSQVASQLKPRIFFKYAPAFNAALKEYSVHHVLSAIEKLVALEIVSKAGEVQNTWVVCHKKLYEILSGQV